MWRCVHCYSIFIYLFILVLLFFFSVRVFLLSHSLFVLSIPEIWLWELNEGCEFFFSLFVEIFFITFRHLAYTAIPVGLDFHLAHCICISPLLESKIANKNVNCYATEKIGMPIQKLNKYIKRIHLHCT